MAIDMAAEQTRARRSRRGVGIDRGPRNAVREFDEPVGWRRAARYGLLAAVTVIVVFPIYTTVIAALKPGDEVLDNPLLPTAFTLDVFREAWTSGHLGRYLLNSLVMAVIVTVFQLVTSVLAAYAFAFLEFPGKRVLFLLFVATLLVPAEATVVVNFQTVDGLGWTNTFIGLSAPFLATAFGIFLLRQVFMTLPRDLLDAASIDGVGHLGFLRHVAVPLVRPDPRGARAVQLPRRVEPVPVAEPRGDRTGHEHGPERAAPVEQVQHRPTQPRDGGHGDRRRADLHRPVRVPTPARQGAHLRSGQGVIASPASRSGWWRY